MGDLNLCRRMDVVKTKLTWMVMVTLTVLLVAALLAAGAKAAPAATPATKSAPAASTAPPAKTQALAAIIEAAKKERTVSVSLTAGYDKPQVVEQLKKAINNKYGADLDIKIQATSGMAGMIAKAIMETKTGAEPTYDVISLSTDYIPRVTKEGIVETVDWRSLFQPGTPGAAQYDHPQTKAGVIIYGGTIGLMYNPQKVAATEVPKKLSDLVDPKWKGRLGMHSYATHWARFAFILGKKQTLTTLRTILKTNKPLLDRYPPLNTRFLAGEIDLVFSVDQYVEENKARGKPTAWQNMDFVEIQDYQLVVMKGTKRPNAAKLLGVFMASPEGAKFTIEVAKKAHNLYPGNQLYDEVASAKKDRIPVYDWGAGAYPGMLDFILSPAYEQWQKEIQLMLDTTS